MGIPSKGNCVFLSGDSYLVPVGVKICVMVHTSPGQVFSPYGSDTPREPPNFCSVKSMSRKQ